MPLYPFETQLVTDANNPQIVVASSSVTFYDPTDTGMVTPITLTDPTGLPMTNPIGTTAQGFSPAFQATIPQVMWSGGGYKGYLNSFQGVLDEAKAAKVAAESAAASAASSAAGGSGIPTGGLDGQVLSKNGTNDFVVEWRSAASGGVTSAEVDPIVGNLVTSGTGATVSALDIRYRRPGVIPIADLPAGSTVVVRKSGTTWPARPTTRSDIIVMWVGADPDPAIITSGTGGALNNVDIRMAI